MKTNMIYSITIVILLIFIFFWAVQCHKDAELEYYTNENEAKKEKMINSFSGTVVSDEQLSSASEYISGVLKLNKDTVYNALKTARSPFDAFSKFILKK